jgi:hypothetical protein
MSQRMHENRTVEFLQNLVTFSLPAFTNLLKVPAAVTWSDALCTAYRKRVQYIGHTRAKAGSENETSLANAYT